MWAGTVALTVVTVTAHPSSTPTERLVRAAARGDQRAWDELVKEFWPVLRRVVGTFRLGAHQVDDVVQTTWLRLVASLGTIAEPAAVPGWLVTTARREAIRALHASGRERLVDAVPEQAETSSTFERIVLNERRDALQAAVGRLPDRQRALAAAILAEPPHGYAAVAQDLAMPVGSIGPIRARCLERLRRDPMLLRAVA
jgi:RNA polymerase sigma factor (sigma-70 family)